MAKKRKTALPRVSVLSYNRRDLLAFVSAVEKLALLVEDLRVMLETKKAKRPPVKPAPDLTVAPEPMP